MPVAPAPALDRRSPPFHRGPVRGSAARLGGELRDEWLRLTASPLAQLRRRGLRAVPLALGATLLVAFFHLVQHVPWGAGLTHDLGGVRADQPLWLALLRTPVSLLVPAPDLPVWGALAQVLIVFGLGELTFGVRRTLFVAYLATLAGTLAARGMVALGPDRFLGIEPRLAHVFDTGPSAAVVGLVVAIAWADRAWTLMAVVWGLMIAEVGWKPNLAGREHLVGMAVVLGYAVASEAWRRGREVRAIVEWTDRRGVEVKAAR
ncbi:MAG: hypothetical protein HOV66_14875 [Streptomycetaceae bacterium]|jgi:hypothetical protein|nr:hypothetical protein [Streptomycetaceae bacterium]